MMTMLTDETLMRYADGMLDRSESERIEQVLAQNPRLRRRVQVFRITGSNLQGIFAEHVNAPIPAKFRELLSPSDAKTAPSWLSALASLLHSRFFSPQWRYGTWGSALQ
jgi:anti-sigma factor RsiW